MKYPYKKLSPEISRPIIPIGISYGKESVNTFALIDSGADICLFGKQFAEILKLPLRLGTYNGITGISGKKQHGYVHRITLTVGGWNFEIDATFLSDENLPTPLLGQKGFFDKFRVTFDYAANEVDIKPNERR